MEILLFILVATNITLLLSFFIKSVTIKLFKGKSLRRILITPSLLVTSLFFMSFVPASKNLTSKLGKEPIKDYDQTLLTKIDSLKAIYAPNINLPEGFELQALIALSHYPEFTSMPIKFIQKDIKTTMACQPDIKHILTTGQRAYIIFIDNNKNGEGIELSEVPFNAQIGVIGHELAHIIDYENKNTVQLLGTGVGYLFQSFKHDLEHDVDAITVKQGLGQNLKEWADFSMYKSSASDTYKAFKRDTYMHSEEIDLLISQN